MFKSSKNAKNYRGKYLFFRHIPADLPGGSFLCKITLRVIHAFSFFTPSSVHSNVLNTVLYLALF